ncbi:MAG: hypothetical protein ACLFUV_08730 [Methanomassiliicoccales archaeon]
MTDWPILGGDFVLGDGASAVAIVGRGEVEVPPDLYAIIGWFKTENLGIERMVANLIANPDIRCLVLCGREEFGHFPGDALLSLHQNGVDGDMRIVGTKAAIPFLCNIPPEAVERFREQVEIVDLLHPKGAEEIIGYDPVYRFDEERRAELLSVLEEHPSKGEPFQADPMVLEGRALRQEGEDTGHEMNSLADFFADQMLRMPSERLSTSGSLMTVSEEFRVMGDPVDGQAREVPSVDLARKMKSYLTGSD